MGQKKPTWHIEIWKQGSGFVYLRKDGSWGHYIALSKSFENENDATETASKYVGSGATVVASM